MNNTSLYNESLFDDLGNRTIPRHWTEEILLAGYFLTTLFGILLGILGTVACCRRFRQAQTTHQYYYHVVFVETLLNLVIVNVRAHILLTGATNDFYFWINVVDFSLNGVIMLTLTANISDICYRTVYPQKPTVMSKKKYTLCLFVAIWLWNFAVILLPPTMLISMTYRNVDYHYLWDTSHKNTLYYVIVVLLAVSQAIPLITILVLAIKISNLRKQQVTVKVAPAPGSRHGKNKQDPSASERRDNLQILPVRGIVVNAVLLGLGHIGLLVLLLADPTLSVSAYVYNWCVIGARMCGVLGMYANFLCDKLLKKELSIGMKCSEHEE